MLILSSFDSTGIGYVLLSSPIVAECPFISAFPLTIGADTRSVSDNKITMKTLEKLLIFPNTAKNLWDNYKTLLLFCS